ncbi:methyltransferase domain-containing protein [Ferrimonas balearica]|uniref:methyltransferase domain-containing protein n=1 Tax=Ferrimonas balearica TaxID=44012 RepID=UPI001C577100|nr:methyltransferase domain-containing protein [Ferrimonas balearica]MBW3138571.1 class I SAM-dependent methyltransferase [Ferrimonas balearica]MBW3163840.1 class I SAM-dependent methyltransferase [Ferrimonas balearica]MBY6105632.1 class I SAM-dependent methyltransferase [Ferrimonas balearica]MBY6223835.1 class I SAM-dependent methyltransferase [Ferrimonas balearica]
MLRPAYSESPIEPPPSWQALPYGDWLKEQVESGLDEWWPRIFGYHLLKLGPLADTLPTRLCPVPHQFGLAPQRGSVRAELTRLPLQNASIDAALVPFCLEFQQDPHALLRELDRVLISGGHLVLVGFSVLSPLAFGYLWPKRHHQFPWSGRLFTPGRIHDWLSLLGYRVLSHESLAHHTMLWSPEKFPTAQRWLADLAPGFGSVYLIVARKMEAPLTPARQRWHLRRPLVGQPVREAVGRESKPQVAARQRRDTTKG